MPLGGFTLSANDISWLGEDLSRPECVLAQRDGMIWCSDDRGGVSRIGADGRGTVIGQVTGTPNGIALDRSGAILIANIGEGTVQRLHRDGRHETVLDALGGKPLGSVNFVYRDGARVWITVSTRTEPMAEAVQQPIPDGYVMLLENGAARIVADEICFTNEVRIDRARRHLYVAETARGRILRFPLSADGSLGPRETYGPDGLCPGARVDGFAFDQEGNLWVTEISRNAIYVIAPDRSCHCVFEDPSARHVNFPTSLCFGGPDLKTVYIGSLRMKRLGVFRAPVAGEPMEHWSE
ncbi:MAG TPA: SMP-30/gluconolactonase/LRE family protein [Stellaceae bacterium]|nr:SMP-30/gluconolactonase/LRE family protein [Stellaceae bacterium]